MNMCGDKAIIEIDGEGAGVGCPPQVKIEQRKENKGCDL